MISLQRKQQGFTIIELLIVIIVIGILATLVITTFSGIQRNARNRAREADVNALHSQIEYYYGQNSVYPALADINSSTWRGTNMQGLDSGALSDPQDASSGALVSAPQAGAYSYATTPSNCDNGTNGDCTSYVLTATYEGGGTFVKNSLN
jgi:prepilin-type N-terminal cleavage/methylation domain-containing protein